MFLATLFIKWLLFSSIHLSVCNVNYENAYAHWGEGSNTSSRTDEEELCSCQPSELCSSPATTEIDIRIVTPPLGFECESDSEYCCFVGSQQCGLRNKNLTSPTPMDSSRSMFGEYPWQAVILNLDNVFIGSGAIIDPYHIITAAHKIANKDKEQLLVRVGDWDLQSECEPFAHIDTRVASVSVHPQFNNETLSYDIAVIRLDQALRLYPKTPHINNICLPQATETFTGQRCWVAGWGKNKFGPSGKYQSVQKEVNVTVVSGDECEVALRHTRLGSRYILDRNSFICAGGEYRRDACSGDGGSPLVCEDKHGRWWVAGLVAWGVGCGRYSMPGIYVNVPSMVPWIKQCIQSGSHYNQ